VSLSETDVITSKLVKWKAFHETVNGTHVPLVVVFSTMANKMKKEPVITSKKMKVISISKMIPNVRFN